MEDVQEPQNVDEGEYLGQRVTVSAEVTDVLDPRRLELAGVDDGEDSLLVRTAEPVADVRQGQVVRVVGTVETEAQLYDAEVQVLRV